MKLNQRIVLSTSAPFLNNNDDVFVIGHGHHDGNQSLSISLTSAPLSMARFIAVVSPLGHEVQGVGVEGPRALGRGPLRLAWCDHVGAAFVGLTFGVGLPARRRPVALDGLPRRARLRLALRVRCYCKRCPLCCEASGTREPSIDLGRHLYVDVQTGAGRMMRVAFRNSQHARRRRS